MKKIALIAALLSSSAFAGPYVGLEYNSHQGTRAKQEYSTNQQNSIYGYEWDLGFGFAHGVEYSGPASSASATLGDKNVETVTTKISYRVSVNNFYASIGRAKLDRDDADLEAESDRATVYGVGYSYPVTRNIAIRGGLEKLQNKVVNTTGFNVGVIARF